jgi:hypothetical protein
MQKDEQRLREKVAELLKAAAAVDAEEDKAHGKRTRGDELPEDLRRAKDRLARIDELKPGPKSQRNFTDPESRIMKSGDGFVQGYNCQAAVDAEHQIIVAQAVTNQPPDVEHLIPMVERVVENCEAIPVKRSADAGYFSEENLVEIVKWKIDPYIARGRRKHGELPANGARQATGESHGSSSGWPAHLRRSKAQRSTRGEK